MPPAGSAYAKNSICMDRGKVLTILLVALVAAVLAPAAYASEDGAARRSARRRAAAPSAPEKPFAERVQEDYIAFYTAGGIFEKLYLMSDKPYYSAGETLHYSGFLVHATLLTRFSRTEFVYVELISPDGRLVERQKVCATDRQFIGTIKLSPRLAAGAYTLRAYSRWQTNFDAGYLYTREVRIGNYIDDAILTSVTYHPNDNGTVTARVRVADSFSIPMRNEQVRYRTSLGGRSRSGTARTNEQGIVEIRFKPTKSDSDGIELNVRANNRDLSRFVQMPSFDEDFDVAFCPEGGNLVAGMLQIVAFKAVRENGRSVEVMGKIYDADGRTVADIATEYKGMGRVVLLPKAGARYWAECTTRTGFTRRFELPEVEPSGVTLRVVRRPGAHTFAVRASEDLDLADFAAVVHSRGAVMSVVEDLSHPMRLADRNLFDGIAQVSGVHKPTLKTVAERLFYVNDRRYARAEISAGGEGFGRRERVELDLAFADSDGKPATGNFAMSVTDASVVGRDADAGNIFSYMLLSSDLKGEVEDAADYFTDDGHVSHDRMELVMLTNGWRRYSLEAVLAHERPRIIYPVEESQRIMGSVFGLFGRVRKPSIVVMEPTTKYVESFQLNDYNNFIISGLDAFSTTTYIVQALNKEGNDSSVNIKIESENYPLVVGAHRRRHISESVADTIPASLLSRAKERYFAEGGEQVIDIEEIVFVGRRSTPFFAAGNTGSMLNGDLTQYGNIYAALATFKELNISGTNITTLPKYLSREASMPDFAAATMHDSGEDEESAAAPEVPVMDTNDEPNTPDLYVNGEIADIGLIDTYELKYVERLSFVDGRAAYMVGLSAPAGAIMMQVSAEGLKRSYTSNAIAHVVVRGCNRPEEFYKPKYETPEARADERRDLRTTIAWEPLIRPDSLGRARVWFYTADRSGRYDITLEGISDGGELCRATRSIEVR